MDRSKQVCIVRATRPQATLAFAAALLMLLG
jgi:hypothetical protein